MSNRIQLYRTTTPNKVPTLAEMLDGELALNITDKQVYARMGSEVVHLNGAAFLVQDATHRFVSDAQIAGWSTPYVLPEATALILGGVKIGENITKDLDGTIHITNAGTSSSGVLSAVDWNTFNGKQAALGFVPLNKAGDTLLGTLVLAADPLTALEAVTKQYTDNGLLTRVNISGSTMTGQLILNGDPAVNLAAATKQYVDAGLSTISGRYGSPVADKVSLGMLVSTTLEDRQLRLCEANGTIYRYDVQATDVADADGVIIPVDVVAPAPGRWFKVQAATQSHGQLNGLQGGTAGDYLHLTTVEKNSYDSHLGDTTVHMSALQGVWMDSISATASEVNFLTGVTSLVQTQLNGKQATIGYTPVNLAGDVMVGYLTLNADPTSAFHAATKNFVESFTVDGGTF